VKIAARSHENSRRLRLPGPGAALWPPDAEMGTGPDFSEQAHRSRETGVRGKHGKRKIFFDYDGVWFIMPRRGA